MSHMFGLTHGLRLTVLVLFCTLGVFVTDSDQAPHLKMNFKRMSTGRSKREVVECPPGTDFQSPGMRVFLTVSPLAVTSRDGDITERQLELNWFNSPVQNGDWVGLFDHDPTVNPLDPLYKVTASEHPDGRYRTSVSYPRPKLRDDAVFERRCLGYWIGYVRAGSTIAMDCLKVQPTWMYDLRNDIGHLKLRELMLPGTHDSGSYDEYKGKASEDVFTRWVLTQDEPFWEQLMYGVRAFDIRMGYYSETTEVFWLNHNFVRVNPFREAIDDLRTFLNQTREIILLDFHQFPVGYTNRAERHSQLLQFLVQELGDHMLERSQGYDVTLNEIWQSGKRLVVAYSDQFYATSPLLWTAMPQVWANTRDPQALFYYLQAAMSDNHRNWWSSMAELTPSTLEVLLSNGSLRLYADKVDQNVTHWFRDLWWNEANVVSVDFFLSTNIVDIVVESNLKRKLCHDAAADFNSRSPAAAAPLAIGGRDRMNYDVEMPMQQASPTFQAFQPFQIPAHLGPRTVVAGDSVQPL